MILPVYFYIDCIYFYLAQQPWSSGFSPRQKPKDQGCLLLYFVDFIRLCNAPFQYVISDDLQGKRRGMPFPHYFYWGNANPSDRINHEGTFVSLYILLNTCTRQFCSFGRFGNVHQSVLLLFLAIPTSIVDLYNLEHLNLFNNFIEV